MNSHLLPRPTNRENVAGFFLFFVSGLRIFQLLHEVVEGPSVYPSSIQ